MQQIAQNFFTYIKESYQELGRVIWPSWQNTVRLTLVVIGVSVAFALILGAFDALLSFLLRLLLLS